MLWQEIQHLILATSTDKTFIFWPTVISFCNQYFMATTLSLNNLFSAFVWSSRFSKNVARKNSLLHSNSNKSGFTIILSYNFSTPACVSSHYQRIYLVKGQYV